MKLPILSAAIGIIAFLPMNFYPAAFIFLVPLFLFFIKENSFWRLLAGAAVFRIIFMSGTVYFTLEPILWISSIIIFLGLPISVYFIKKIFISKSLIINPQSLILILLPFLWTLFDHLEARYSLMPAYIMTAGNALGSSPFLGLAIIGGQASLTLFVAIINAVAAGIIYKFQNKTNDKKIKIPLIVIVSFLLVGFLLSRSMLEKKSENYDSLKNSLTVTAISANEKFSAVDIEQLEYSLSEKKHELIIFPEDLLNGSLDNFALFGNIAKKSNAYVVAAFDIYRDDKKYNSTAIFDKNGNIDNLSDKTKLTFMGEYWPFEKWRPFFIDWLSKSNPDIKKYAVFDQKNQYSIGEKQMFRADPGQIFSSLICLEIQYSLIVKKIKENGAGFIANPSSSRWVKTGIKHFLYLETNVKKIMSVNFNIPIISAGVNGYASAITPDGKIESVGFENEKENFSVLYKKIKY